MLCFACGNAVQEENPAKHSVGLKLAGAKKAKHFLQSVSNY